MKHKTLIENIVKSYTTENLFETIDDLKLQEKLKILKFENNLTDMKMENGNTTFTISFKDENNILKVIDFTITPNPYK